MSSRAGSGSNRLAEQQEQGSAAGLVVMVAVLCFMLAYCCWGAPCCRSGVGGDDCSMSSRASTPNILLLPHGRILLLDQTVITHFQNDLNINAQDFSRNEELATSRSRRGLLRCRESSYDDATDSESKDCEDSLSPALTQGIPPPAYDSLFSETNSSSSTQSFPPAYEDIAHAITINNDKGSIAIAESRV